MRCDNSSFNSAPHEAACEVAGRNMIARRLRARRLRHAGPRTEMSDGRNLSGESSMCNRLLKLSLMRAP